MSMEYLQFKKQAETQLAAMEPTKRMQTDQNCATAIAQATDDATRNDMISIQVLLYHRIRRPTFFRFEFPDFFTDFLIFQN